MTREVKVSADPSLPVLLTCLFVGLKLGGVVGWSWVWVLAPLWITLGLAACILSLVVMGLILAGSRKR